MGLWEKRIRVGKSSSLKQQTKEAESHLDATSVMLAREQAKIQAKKVVTNESPKSKNKLRSMVSGMLAERKSVWTSTTNITSKSVFGFLSATSIELQLLEICKAMGCSFETDETIKPRQYIGKNNLFYVRLHAFFFLEHVFNFSLHKGQLKLKSILKWSIINFNVCIETRPSAVAYTVAARTESINIETNFSGRKDENTNILSSNNLLHSKGMLELLYTII